VSRFSSLERREGVSFLQSPHLAKWCKLKIWQLVTPADTMGELGEGGVALAVLIFSHLVCLSLLLMDPSALLSPQAQARAEVEGTVSTGCSLTQSEMLRCWLLSRKVTLGRAKQLVKALGPHRVNIRAWFLPGSLEEESCDLAFDPSLTGD